MQDSRTPDSKTHFCCLLWSSLLWWPGDSSVWQERCSVLPYLISDQDSNCLMFVHPRWWTKTKTEYLCQPWVIYRKIVWEWQPCSWYDTTGPNLHPVPSTRRASFEFQCSAVVIYMDPSCEGCIFKTVICANIGRCKSKCSTHLDVQQYWWMNMANYMTQGCLKRSTSSAENHCDIFLHH